MTALDRWWRVRRGSAADFSPGDVFEADQVIHVAGSDVVRLSDGVTDWEHLPRLGGPGERPEDYGAVGNGTTDDTAAISAADAAARAAGTHVQFAPVTYRASLTLFQGSDWRGAGTTGSGSPSSRIRSLSGSPAVTLNPAAPVYNARICQMSLLGEGGGAAVFKDDLHQHDGITFTDCQISAFAASGIRILGGISSITLERCNIFGSPCGIDLEIGPAHQAVMDWWRLAECIVSGTTHGLRFLAVNAGGHGWMIDRVRFAPHPQASHTILINAWAKHWTWRNVIAAEGQGGGYWTTKSTFLTTASATAGQSTVTLADATPIEATQRLTINGAGGAGDHYEGVVLSKNGSVVTLDVPIGTTVSDAACTNAVADILHCGPDYGVTGPWVGQPLRHVFIACDMGRGDGSVIRYALNDGGGHVFINHESYNAPIRDPYQSALVFGFQTPLWSSPLRAPAGGFPPGTTKWDAVNNRPLFSDGANWRTATGTIVT